MLLGKIGCTGLPTECTVLGRKSMRAQKKEKKKKEKKRKKKMFSGSEGGISY